MGSTPYGSGFCFICTVWESTWFQRIRTGADRVLRRKAVSGHFPTSLFHSRRRKKPITQVSTQSGFLECHQHIRLQDCSPIDDHETMLFQECEYRPADNDACWARRASETVSE